MVYRFYCMALFHSQAQRHVINVFLAMKHFHIRCQVKRNVFHCYSDISSVSLFHVKFKQLVLLIECWNLAFFLRTQIKINKKVSIQFTNEPQHLGFQQCGMCDQQSKYGCKDQESIQSSNAKQRLRSACTYAQSDQSLC